jgi:biopolymer transport protein TolR
MMVKKKVANNSEQSVVISADKKVRYEEVIEVMDMLQQQNIKKIGLLTKAR